MKSKLNFNIAIIGGGMVGASLALLLAQKNPEWKIALLEAQAVAGNSNPSSFYQPSFDSRSTAIAQGSVEIFESLGVWKLLSEQATAINTIHVSDAGHLIGGLIQADDYAVDAVGYVIPNQWIGQILLSAIKQVPQITFLSSTKVEKIIPKISGACLQIKTADNFAEINIELVVMADGSQSVLATQLGIDFLVENYQQTAIIANVSFSQAHQNVAYERFTDLGPIALLPLGKKSSAQESALVLTLPNDQAKEMHEASDEIFLAHLQKRFGNRLGKFTRVGERKTFPLQLVTAKEQIRSHLVLIGNAAHFLHPVAGQGFNLSLRDCVCLSNQLAKSTKPLGDLSVLEMYLAQQRRDQNTTILFSDQLVKLFSSSRLSQIALRHLGFLGLESIPGVKKLLVDQTMGRAV